MRSPLPELVLSRTTWREFRRRLSPSVRLNLRFSEPGPGACSLLAALNTDGTECPPSEGEVNHNSVGAAYDVVTEAAACGDSAGGHHSPILFQFRSVTGGGPSTDGPAAARYVIDHYVHAEQLASLADTLGVPIDFLVEVGDGVTIPGCRAGYDVERLVNGTRSLSGLRFRGLISSIGEAADHATRTAALRQTREMVGRHLDEEVNMVLVYADALPEGDSCSLSADEIVIDWCSIWMTSNDRPESSPSLPRLRLPIVGRPSLETAVVSLPFPLNSDWLPSALSHEGGTTLRQTSGTRAVLTLRGEDRNKTIGSWLDVPYPLPEEVMTTASSALTRQCRLLLD